MKIRIRISFAEGVVPNFISRTEIWFSGFRLASLVSGRAKWKLVSNGGDT